MLLDYRLMRFGDEPLYLEDLRGHDKKGDITWIQC